MKRHLQVMAEVATLLKTEPYPFVLAGGVESPLELSSNLLFNNMITTPLRDLCRRKSELLTRLNTNIVYSLDGALQSASAIDLEKEVSSCPLQRFGLCVATRSYMIVSSRGRNAAAAHSALLRCLVQRVQSLCLIL